MAVHLESYIQSQIVSWLKKEGYMVIRNLDVSPIGFPDLTCISKEGVYTHIEVKQVSGRLSPGQQMTISKLNDYNCNVIVARSLQEVKDYYEL